MFSILFSEFSKKRLCWKITLKCFGELCGVDIHSCRFAITFNENGDHRFIFLRRQILNKIYPLIFCERREVMKNISIRFSCHQCLHHIRLITGKHTDLQRCLNLLRTGLVVCDLRNIFPKRFYIPFMREIGVENFFCVALSVSARSRICPSDESSFFGTSFNALPIMYSFH